MFSTIQNHIKSAHSYIKTTQFDAPFFKNVMFIPVVGQIVQIWKRQIQYAELNAMSLDPANYKGAVRRGGFIEITEPSPLANKSVEIVNFSVNSFNNGRWADVACVIAGFALIHISPITLTIGAGMCLFGVTSLITRKFILLFVDMWFTESKYNKPT